MNPANDNDRYFRWRDTMCLIAMILLLCLIMVSCGKAFFPALQDNEDNQRKIARIWEHTPGLYEYNQFAERNK